MKSRHFLGAFVVLIIGYFFYIGWVIHQDDKPINTISGQTVAVSEDQVKLQNEVQTLQARVATLEASKPKTVVIDREQECAKQADKYFSQIDLDSDLKRSTYRSHWNIGRQACMLELTVMQTDSRTGETKMVAIADIDITNNKTINNCVVEAPKGDGLSCENSIFLTFQEMLMTQ